MGILAINTQFPGQVGVQVRRIPMISTDTLATVTTAGYLNQATLAGNVIYPTDIIVMWYGYVSNRSPGTYAEFIPAFNTETQQITLSLLVNPGDVLLPVTSGDFAVFNGTSGQIKDASYSPSNAAKTKVVMANGATIAGHIACYTDTAGTAGVDATTAINGGNIQAGLSGTAGTVASFPATASKGALVVAGVANTGNTNVTISNAAHGQASVYSIQDSGSANANLVNSLVNKGIYAGVVSFGGGSAGPTVISISGSPAGVAANATNKTAANACYVKLIDASVAGQITVTWSADPGAGTLNYAIFT